MMVIMSKLQLLLSLVTFISVLAAGHAAKSMETIEVHNPYVNADNDGHWGDEEHCPTGHAFAFEIKYEEPGSADWTAVNAVKLYCRDGNGDLTGEITSFEGKYGNYKGVRSCANNYDMMTGFRLRVWPYQGTFGDDWAVDNVQISCKSNMILDGMGDPVSQEAFSTSNKKLPGKSISKHMEMIDIPMASRGLLHGDWTNWAYCSEGYYVCGIVTLVEQGHVLSDDAGLVDVRLFCSNNP